jgi:hypothetical protein
LPCAPSTSAPRSSQLSSSASPPRPEPTEGVPGCFSLPECCRFSSSVAGTSRHSKDGALNQCVFEMFYRLMRRRYSQRLGTASHSAAPQVGNHSPNLDAQAAALPRRVRQRVGCPLDVLRPQHPAGRGAGRKGTAPGAMPSLPLASTEFVFGARSTEGPARRTRPSRSRVKRKALRSASLPPFEARHSDN